MSSSRTVVVVGAQDRFGRVAVEAFAAAGWQVHALGRRPPEGVPQVGVRWLDAALTDRAALVRRAAGARVRVHAANPPNTQWPAHALPLARASMDLAQRLGATFMLPGNVYGLGPEMPPRLVETTPMRPSTRKGTIRVAMEAELRQRADDRLDSVVVRTRAFPCPETTGVPT